MLNLSFNLAGFTGFGSFSLAHVGHRNAKVAATASSEPPVNLIDRASALDDGCPKFECKVLIAVSKAGVKVDSIGSVNNTSCPEPSEGRVNNPAIKDFTNGSGYLSVALVRFC